MKRLHVLFLAALSSSLLLAGCGKDAEEQQPVVGPIVEAQPELEKENTESAEQENQRKRQKQKLRPRRAW